MGQKVADVVLLTGLSGAGKTTALLAFEELGYYCIENVPLPILDNLLNLISEGREEFKKSVIVVSLLEASEAFEKALNHANLHVKTVGLYASNSELISRYKLTRHIHPYQVKGYSLAQSLEKEEQNFKNIKSDFDIIIDTSSLTIEQFKEKVVAIFEKEKYGKFTINFISFGYKIGVPYDADVVIDARILNNPFWEPTLKHLTGLDEPIVNYIFDNDIGKDFKKQVEAYLSYYLSFYLRRTRSYYSIAIGCTGGQHRSVASVEYFAKVFSSKFNIMITHRDLIKGLKTE